MAHTAEQLLQRALARQMAALGDLVALIIPWIQVRVARQLLRRLVAIGEPALADQVDLRHQIERSTEEILLHLFADDARLLRSWQPERQPSFESFIARHTELWLQKDEKS